MTPIAEKAASWTRRPLPRWGVVLLVVFLGAAPAWLFANPLGTYRLHSDDFPYLAASRTLPRTLSNLFAPHNTHVVPSWRLVTWSLMAVSGTLAAVPSVLAKATFGIVLATMLLMGVVVTRETGRAAIGAVAMMLVASTSQMKEAATWYSAGQTYWAGFGIVATLGCLQSYRFSGRLRSLAFAAFWTIVAGGFWTIGHAAGPVGAIYLWVDGRPRCRKAAIVPLLATALAVSINLGLGGRQIDSKVSFHGRNPGEAFSIVNGALYTIQAIPEDLVFGGLGLSVPTTLPQAAVLGALVVAAWGWGQRNGRRAGPMEWAGAALMTAAYLVEWSFRGYLEFKFLRGVVPWYDTIPLLGGILFLCGWWGRSAGADRIRTDFVGSAIADQSPSDPRSAIADPTKSKKVIEPTRRGEAIGILLLQIGLIAANQGRVDAQFEGGVPGPSAREAETFVTPELKRLRAIYLADQLARHQRRFLAKLDQAEVVARKRGIGRKAVRDAFGRLDAPELPSVYDAADLLDLPEPGTEADSEAVRQLLGPFFRMEPAPTVPSEFLKP